VRETAAVTQEGDAADDPAIWVAPDPAQSLVIATQKQGGLYVFDLSGAIVQEVPGGRPNNVDLRAEFPFADGPGVLVGASDRTDNALAFWRFDPVTRQLEVAPRARIATGFAEIYGFCLGRMGDDYVAIATDKDTGEVGAWRLVIGPDGAITGERFIAYTLGSISEGCVVDDETGAYYVAEENVGVWRAELADSGGDNRRLIAAISDNEHLIADIEGLSLWRGAAGAGYLVASVQGNSTYAVFDRGDDNSFRGVFSIAPSADGAADGAQHTDGIDIAPMPLGPDFPAGLMVVQDGENTDPEAMQNFKYVSWADVAATLQLP
jgi:3-phytase